MSKACFLEWDPYHTMHSTVSQQKCILKPQIEQVYVFWSGHTVWFWVKVKSILFQNEYFINFVVTYFGSVFFIKPSEKFSLRDNELKWTKNAFLKLGHVAIERLGHTVSYVEKQVTQLSEKSLQNLGLFLS